MKRYRPFQAPVSSDLLYGAEAIATYLGISVRACRYRIEQRQIPTFKIGGTVCSRQKTLDDWMDEQIARAGDS